MSIKKKIIAGSFIDIFGSVLAAIISFVLIRLYFDVLTKEEYGLWLAINGLASLISLVDLGVDQYFTTVIANDKTFFDSHFNTEFSNSIFIKSVISTLFFIIGVFLFIFLSSIIDINPEYLSVAKITIAVNICYFMFNIFFSSANTILIGRNHFSLVNSITIFSNVISGILTYSLLVSGYGIVSFPISLFVLALIQFLILAKIINKKYPHIRFGKVNFKGKRGMINYSFSFQIIKLAHIIRTQYIVIAINNLAGPSFVTIYNMSNKIPSMIPGYFSKIVMPMFPSLSMFVSNDDYKSSANVILKLTKVLFRFAFFFSIAVYIFNEAFVNLWIGKDKFGGSSIDVWNIIYMFILSAFSGFGIIIYSTKKFEKWTYLAILEIFLVIGLSYLLNHYYGFVGIISGFVLGSIPSQLYLAYISLKQIKLNFTELFKEYISYIIVPNVLSLFIAFLLKYFLVFNNWSTLIGAIFVYTLTHFILYEGVKFFRYKNSDIKLRIVKSFDL